MDDYPLLELFFTMLWFFLFIVWIWLLISLFADIFRSSDLSGWMKALWCLFIIVLPILGSLIYLIARGHSMVDRSMSERRAQESQFRDYVRDAASSSGGGGGVADELSKLATLRDSGTLTDAEFEAQKAKLLA
jgi:Short C-terminal domain/Phospholipase_D-nuclease N-terminal